MAQERPRITGFFSDMRLIPENGDLLGTEIWIVYARNRHWATVQLAEGEPGKPLVVPVEVTGTKIRFTFPLELYHSDGSRAPDRLFRFEGEVSRAGLAGMFNGNPVLLKRRQSFWQ